MKTVMKKISETEVEIKVVLGAEEMEEAHGRAVAKLARKVKVPGFRAGKAPMDLAEQRIEQTALLDEELNMAVNVAVVKACAENKVQPLVLPKVEVEKFVPKEMMEFVMRAEVLPEVKLGDYKKLKARRKEIEVTEKDVEEILENIALMRAKRVKVERAVKKGDEAVIDFVGKEDGKEFAGGRAEDYVLPIGSGQFIKGFEEGIVGKKAGEEFVLDLTFPKDYPAKEHAGKKVQFEVKLKAVKEVQKPEFDKKFAKEAGGFASMEELRADIRKNLAARNEGTIVGQWKDDLVEELVKASKVVAPEVMIRDQMQMVRMDMERNLVGYEMTLEEYLEEMGETMEEWEKEARKMAEARVKASLVLHQVALVEKIEVEEAAVETNLAELTRAYGKAAAKELADERVRNDLRNRMVIEKTLEFLMEVNG